jgi:hypothetical protein
VKKSRKKSARKERRPSIKKELTELQHEFAESDWLARPHTPGLVTFIVYELQDIKIRMDGDKNHGRPHIHVQYGKDPHAASYAIDNGKRLAGDLPSRYDRMVREFIGTTRPKLKEIWDFTQAGKSTDALVGELRGSRQT